MPQGFAVTDRLFRALVGPVIWSRDIPSFLAEAQIARARVLGAPWPDGFLDALALKLTELSRAESSGQRFSVRSSFAGEDDPGALGAGVYESRIDLDAVDVPGALREVLAAALTPAALAYAIGIGANPMGDPCAALVHRFVPGATTGTAARSAKGHPIIEWKHADPTPLLRAEIVAALDTVVGALGPSEIEWTATGATVTYLQWRPYVAPPQTPVWSGFLDLPLSENSARWKWDVAHNPAPLSAAQAGLVAWVDEQCRIGLRQVVLGRYLFYAASDDRWPDEQLAPAEARAAFDDLVAQVDLRVRAMGFDPPLEPALALYAHAYERLYGVIQPAARRARALLVTFLRTNLPDAEALLPQLLAGVPSVATERRMLAQRWGTGDDGARVEYLDKFGDESGAWDVSAPTWRESHPPAPQQVPDAHFVHADLPRSIQDRLPRMARGAWKNLLPIARDAAALAEDDDWLFARLQATVRRALLVLGRRAVTSGHLSEADQIFDLPLSIIRAFGEGQPVPADLDVVARASRRGLDTARALPPPLYAGGIAPTGVLVRGVGTGGRVVGTIHLFRGLSALAPPPSCVLLATTLLPTELPLIHAAALVIATGGVLDHVAAQARERRIPAVVGATHALSLLQDGDQVLVDADAGLVVRLLRA